MKKIISDSKQVMDRYTGLTRDEMITMMDKALSQIPEDEHSSATFEIDQYSYPYDPNDYYALFMKFKRLETDVEENEREAQEVKMNAEIEARDRAAYERLKKQFG